MILQNLWLEKVDWDDPISEKLQIEWKNFEKELSELRALKIPRAIAQRHGSAFQLHGYADASERAFGACVYLRASYEYAYSITLIISKSRVAPIKTQTIPRLELCAALLLAELTNKVIKSLRLSIERIFLWSDSTIALSWIRTSPHVLKTFVANRVKKIQEIMTDAEWRYVPSGENPADLLSRGISASELIKSRLWWHGPMYLELESSQWPENPSGHSEAVPEKKEKINCYITTDFERVDISKRFSSLKRAKRILAYCFRFCKKCTSSQERRISGPLTVAELDYALHAMIRNSQAEFYASEIHQLNSGKELNVSSNLLSLRPYLDDEGLLRVGGRLQFSDLTHSQRHPIILPPKANLTLLIFNDIHERLGHAGPAQTLFAVRERFWPIHGRKLAKGIVHRCIQCFRACPKTKMLVMGSLPTERVSPSYPFEISGVDYAGPFSLKRHKGRGAKIVKGYLSTFVCFATKATHMEVVSDLSTEAFIAALKRFISRRGKPREIHSDNGTNFVGASNELKAVITNLKHDNEKVSHYLGNEGISWRFIPASAPHFGGLWESTVKRTKFHLKRILANTSFTFEGFCTVTCQIEAILNSRPLSPLSDHPEDLEPLTPSHFLIGRTLTTVPEVGFQNVPVTRLSSFKRLQQLVQNFWSRWKREYLPELQPRSKWRKENGSHLQIGDLALIRDDNQPPLCWPLGRIIETHKGKDGVIRVVTLRTRRYNVRRPATKVFPLPRQSSEE